MADLQPVRGTRDLIGDDQRRYAHVVDTAKRLAGYALFDEWQTPIFEDTRVFSRTLGDTSDVVTKEMYSFADRGGDSITLRPEGTAGICRALISNGLTQSLPQKVFYAGPMFRYERPQKGRYRQFHQIGAELIGVAEPMADAEVILLGGQIIRSLGITEGVTLELNTLGDPASRAAYRAALVSYFEDHRGALSADSQTRLVHNPLRILDSKDPGDRTLLADAPIITAFLTPEADAFYSDLRRALDRAGQAYVENPRIVRGLDYYNHTAFEFVTDRLGAQGTVLAGGRYDGLVAQLGGPSVPGVGWAAGIERLSMLMTELPAPTPIIAVIPLSEAENDYAFGITHMLRSVEFRTDQAFRGNLKRRMERANRLGARLAIIVGDTERAGLYAQVKDLQDGSQMQVPVAELMRHVAARLKPEQAPMGGTDFVR